MKTLFLPDLQAHLRFHDLPGLGTPLLFLHGFGCASSCDFPRVASDPLLQPRRRLLVDLLGTGFSDRPEGFSYTLDAHAQVILALVDALQLSCVDLYGHSMGGAIAILTATEAPHRIRRLVASEPPLNGQGGPDIQATAAQTEAEYVASGHARAVRKAVAEGNPIWAGTLAASSPIAIHREAVSRLQGGTPPWRAQLLALPMPRTIVFGERSLPHPEHTRLPENGVRVDVVPAAGHSMMWENPTGLAGALQAALA